MVQGTVPETVQGTVAVVTVPGQGTETGTVPGTQTRTGQVSGPGQFHP